MPLDIEKTKKAVIFSLDNLLFSVSSSSNLVFQKRASKVKSGFVLWLTRLLFLGDSYPFTNYQFFDSNRIEIKSYSSKSAPDVSKHFSYFQFFRQTKSYEYVAGTFIIHVNELKTEWVFNLGLFNFFINQSNMQQLGLMIKT